MVEYTGLKVARFCERFSKLCDSNTMSITALADKLGVSRQTLYAWQNGTRSPKLPTVTAIASYFDVSVEWLMGYDVEMRSGKYKLVHEEDYDHPKTIEAKLISGGIDKLPKEKREQALQMFKIMFEPQFSELFTKEMDENDDAT